MLFFVSVDAVNCRYILLNDTQMYLWAYILSWQRWFYIVWNRWMWTTVSDCRLTKLSGSSVIANFWAIASLSNMPWPCGALENRTKTSIIQKQNDNIRCSINNTEHWAWLMMLPHTPWEPAPVMHKVYLLPENLFITSYNTSPGSQWQQVVYNIT